MGRSTVNTSSYAVDNRLAVTDNGLGLSNYGGKMAFQAPVFDFSQAISASGKKTSAAGAGGVNGVNISILDGGAINKSFDFAAFSLSEVLGHLIDSQKSQQDATQYTADSIASAMQQAATTQAAAVAATNAAASEIAAEQTKTIGGLMKWAEENGTKLLVIGAAGFVVWKLWGPK